MGYKRKKKHKKQKNDGYHTESHVLERTKVITLMRYKGSGEKHINLTTAALIEKISRTTSAATLDFDRFIFFIMLFISLIMFSQILVD